MWPIKKKEPKYGFRTSASGSLTFDLTDEEREEVEHSFKMFEDYQIKSDYAEEFEKGIIAFSLTNYAQGLMVWDSDTEKDSIQKAIAATSKAYSIHQLPIYLYDLAVYSENLGESKKALDMYDKFLSAFNQYEETSVDRILLVNRDVEGAVKHAQSKLGRN